MKNKVGKPKQFAIEYLETLLLKYVEDHPTKTITFIDLERVTGVGRNTWSRNMRGKIEKLNQPIPLSYAGNENFLPLPNMTELVKCHYGNQQNLIQALQQVNNSIQKLYIQAKCVPQLEQEIGKLQTELVQAKDQSKKDKETIRSLQEQVNHFSQAYKDIAMTSSSPDSDLKNILAFKRGDKKNEDKISADLINQFSMFGPKL